MPVRRHLAALLRDTRGALLIETAIVAPVLVLMSLGAFQVSSMVARQSELQSAVAEASAIALAVAPDTSAKRATVKSVIMASSGLASGHVTVSNTYRCGTTATYQNGQSCSGSSKLSEYVKIELTDTYTPIWTEFGVGGPMNYNVTRYVMIAQDD